MFERQRDTPVNLTARSRLSVTMPRLPATLLLLLGTLVLVPAPAAHAAPRAMPPLAMVTLPQGTDSVGSSTVAFDGEVFYFLTGYSTKALYRVKLARSGSAVTATALPPIDVGTDVHRFFYDARHRALVIQTAADTTTQVSQLFRYDLRTGTTRRLFAVTDITYSGAAYDWRSDRHLVINGSDLTSYDTRGKSRSCPLTYDDGTTVDIGPSGVVGSGDGELYSQAEDDTTVVRVGADCHIKDQYAHRAIAESTAEDDSLACDGVTFGTPVLWLRDTATTTMTAYGLPAGACALPTSLTVTASATRACATLRRAEVAVPVAGQAVSLRLDGGNARTVTTDATGAACLPLSVPAGTHGVTASYAGSRSWAPASARASVVVHALPPRIVPRTAPPRIARHPLGNAYPGSAPLPQAGAAAAQPPVNPLPGTHVAAQQAYGNASLTQVVPGAVPAPETQRRSQLALAMSDAGADRRTSPVPVAQMLGAALVSAVAVAAARRTSPAVERVSAGR
jgi:hypothetical protein